MPLEIKVQDPRTKRWRLAALVGAEGLSAISISNNKPDGSREVYSAICVDERYSTIRVSGGPSPGLKELRRGNTPFFATVKPDGAEEALKMKFTHR